MPTLEVPDMVPNKFQPIGRRHFMFCIEGIDAFLIKSANRPTVTTEKVDINWINSQRKIAGKTTFGSLSVTLHEAIAPSAAMEVMEWIRLCYESVSGRAGYADFYKRDIQIKMLDPIGTVIQLWDIKGAFITEANFGELNYDGSDLTEIQLTIEFDNMTLQY